MKKKDSSGQWYEVGRNHNIGFSLMFFCLKVFPPVFVRILSYFVGFFYWIFSANVRRASKKYLVKVGKRSTLKHICSFALNIVENIQTWAGNFSFSDIEKNDDDVMDLIGNINSGAGTLLIISHLGNAQMMKALACLCDGWAKEKISITTISDENVYSGFNERLKKLNATSSFNHVDSDNIGPETIIFLQERLEKGDVVVIAGDRVSSNASLREKSARNIEIPFLGEKAKFPYGVFLLASLLDCPTYFINGLRKKDFCINPRYSFFVKKNSLSFDCPRKERDERIKKTAFDYAANLEGLCRKHPYQWYNFFDFWA